MSTRHIPAWSSHSAAACRWAQAGGLTHLRRPSLHRLISARRPRSRPAALFWCRWRCQYATQEYDRFVSREPETNLSVFSWAWTQGRQGNSASRYGTSAEPRLDAAWWGNLERCVKFQSAVLWILARSWFKKVQHSNILIPEVSALGII